MDGAMDVRKAFARCQRGGWGGGFQLKEWAHWFGPGRRRTIVVAICRVAAVGVILELPERIDVISGAGGHSVLHDGKHLVVSVVTARYALAALGVHADLAAVLAVRGEVDHVVLHHETVRRNRAEVIGRHLDAELGLRAALDWDHDGRPGRRREHAENPDRKQSRVF